MACSKSLWARFCVPKHMSRKISNFHLFLLLLRVCVASNRTFSAHDHGKKQLQVAIKDFPTVLEQCSGYQNILQYHTIAVEKTLRSSGTPIKRY